MAGLGWLYVQLLALMGWEKFWREYVGHMSYEVSGMTYVVRRVRHDVCHVKSGMTYVK